jgi:hypothetical protein
MGQIRMLKVAPQQNCDNILSDVVIHPDLEQLWLDTLGQFAGMMRLLLGTKRVVSIENDKGFINSDGELVVTAVVNSAQIVQAAFPAGTWGWRGTANS